jgi:hypothetical protein
MHVSLSSRTLLTLAIVLPALSGCPDPQARFDEFVGRVPDANVITTIDAPPLEELPDITGEHLLGFAPVIAPDTPFQFIATATLTQNMDGTGMLDLSMVALDITNRMPVGGTTTVSQVPVSTSGSFTLHFTDVTIPGEANPITGSPIFAPVVDLIGVIRSTDRFCGTVEGMVTSPIEIDLMGSTFSAIRIPPGTTGLDLPPVEKECPASMPADAGPVDAAAPPDAVPPDGAP